MYVHSFFETFKIMLLIFYAFGETKLFNKSSVVYKIVKNALQIVWIP